MRQLVGWTAKSAETMFGKAVEIALTLRNSLEAGIRMIDGSIRFDDRLGHSIGSIQIEKDARIAVGSDYRQSGSYQTLMSELGRLASVDPADVKATVCVTALIKEDGGVQRFDE